MKINVKEKECDLQPNDSHSSHRSAVLMSTFNGLQYIGEQISSILEQLEPSDQIFVRDDGSTDGTLEWLRAHPSEQIILVNSDRNIGFGSSFMSLIDCVPADFDQYFFSDQDDVWLPGKIRRAQSMLVKHGEPAMICSRLIISNEALRPAGLSPDYRRQASFDNAICQNIATGCTIAFNTPAIKLLKKTSRQVIGDDRLYFHDWWCYLVVSFFGTVLFDPVPTVLYRQHSTNQIGMGVGIKRYTNMARSLIFKPWTPILIQQLDLFLSTYNSNLSHGASLRLKRLCQGRRMSIFFSLMTDENLYWQRSSDKILFKLLAIWEMLLSLPNRHPSKRR